MIGNSHDRGFVQRFLEIGQLQQHQHQLFVFSCKRSSHSCGESSTAASFLIYLTSDPLLLLVIKMTLSHSDWVIFDLGDFF
ncbi:hypothetical protein EDM56_26535 [Brevibacillus fluminis]|uniref:Uncharacterized protein n=1 Tax=Brevibacillus fluminis TaxID=511487 RepID=A0A3M8CZX0_9BACL|nr:hypothetical protein [Brevibacillus fluminis]RNB81273.1 hypothetical protein EDM56_26535 [Brevibacillus fluminis]